MRQEHINSRIGHQQLLQKSLQKRYSSSQNYFYSNLIKGIVRNKCNHATIAFADIQCLVGEQQFLKRPYNESEVKAKFTSFKQFYYYHEDCPRIFGDCEMAQKYENWQERKRDLVYKKLKIMFNESSSSSQITQKSNRQQKNDTHSTNILMNISEYNPSSKAYYLKAQAQHKQKKQKNVSNSSMRVLQNLNHDIHNMLFKIELDLSNITNVNSSQISEIHEKQDPRGSNKTKLTVLMDSKVRMQKHMHKQQGVYLNRNEENCKQAKVHANLNVNMNSSKLNRHETTSSCSKILQSADTKNTNKCYSCISNSSHSNNKCVKCPCVHSKDMQKKVVTKGQVLLVSERGGMNKNLSSKSQQLGGKREQKEDKNKVGLCENRSSFREIRLLKQPADIKQYKNIILQFKNSANRYALKPSLSNTKLNKQPQNGQANALAFRSRQMSMKKIEYKGETGERGQEFNDHKIQNVLTRYQSEMLPSSKPTIINTNPESHLSLKIKQVKQKREVNKNSVQKHENLANKNENRRVKINFNMPALNKKYSNVLK